MSHIFSILKTCISFQKPVKLWSYQHNTNINCTLNPIKHNTFKHNKKSYTFIYFIYIKFCTSRICVYVCVSVLEKMSHGKLISIWRTDQRTDRRTNGEGRILYSVIYSKAPSCTIIFKWPWNYLWRTLPMEKEDGVLEHIFFVHTFMFDVFIWKNIVECCTSNKNYLLKFLS